MQTYYAMIRRIDGSEFHAATVTAESLDAARKAYAPDYGCGIRFSKFHPQMRINARAVDIIAV